MSPSRILALLIWSVPVTTVARADDPAAHRQRADRPAVLIVPAWQAPPARPPTRYVEVVPPSVITPPQARPVDDQTLESAAPPPGYRLVGTYAPNPLWSSLRYFVYVDLRDRQVARNWRAWQRAIRAEQREAEAEQQSLRAWARRKQHLLSAHSQAVAEGLEYFRDGRYRHAIVAFTRAADLNHADPGCRIHLAQARVAVGHDAQAAQVLRRALELQPKLIPRQLDLHACYAVPEELDVHVDALAARLVERPASADEYLLLGFFEFQRDRFDAAHAAFARAAQSLPQDDVITAFLELTRPVRP